jgi:hypothetical protein
MAELSQQLAVKEKESAQDFEDGEDMLTVGNRIECCFLEMMAELNLLLGMAGGTGNRRLRNRLPRQERRERVIQGFVVYRKNFW